MSMHFRPKIQNGPVSKRAKVGYTSTSAPRPSKPSPSATLTPVWSGVSVGELAQSGLATFGLDERLQSTQVVATEKVAAHSRVLLGLIGCGVLLAGGFMFSLRDHFTAHAFGREEVKVKSKIEQAEAAQQQLDMKLKRVSSPQVLEQAARDAGLVPLEMERKNGVIAIKKVAAAEKAKTPPAAKTSVAKGKAAEH